ncbi:HAD-IB family phosphatase [Butyrivibrio sp. NC3005]|uniref:HAD-IB family phosphatase n=1 Tax=Butyrivibrio sp. NC3005 TaxID=1280685 RepID=UPI000425AAA8|nr:HAD-IB family phosphatase [Butyrivibrio sp. NC3005]
MRKIALFDFCDTIVNFQTADNYVIYYAEMRYGENLRNKNYDKFQLLNCLKGEKKSDIEFFAERYYLEMIKPGLQTVVIDFIKKYQDTGYEIYIVSAGYSVYIDFFAKEFKVNGIIANDFLYQDEIFLGTISNRDCISEEKVQRLNEFFDKCEIEDSVSFSDSISDLPFLKWSNRGIVISKFRSREWIKKNGLEEIVLSNYGI